MTAPKAFISYSWSSDAHIDWVLNLATMLRQNGVDAHVDKWDLREGHDAYAYMERMVNDPEVTKVIMVCDQAYATKANSRSGGVGTEAQIISPEIYRAAEQDKFVAIVREKDADGNALVPSFYGSRIHIDMTDDELFADNLQQLLRWIFDEPAYPKPVLGAPPQFLRPQQGVSVGDSLQKSIAVSALKSGQSNATLLFSGYLESIADDMANLRLPSGQTDDEDIWKSIEDFESSKNDISEVFGVASRVGLNDEATATLIRFFERIGNYQVRAPDASHYSAWDWDNFRFIVRELFLTLSAKLLRYDRFEALNELLSAQYYVPTTEGSESALKPFTFFNLGVQSFEARNTRLQLNRLSVAADLLKKRCEGSGLEFSELKQADLVLYFRETADSFLAQEEWTRPWRAHTLIFAAYDGPTEKFLRATSRSYFDRFKVVLGCSSIDEFRQVTEAIGAGKVQRPPSDYGRPDVLKLLNASEVATKP